MRPPAAICVKVLGLYAGASSCLLQPHLFLLPVALTCETMVVAFPTTCVVPAIVKLSKVWITQTLLASSWRLAQHHHGGWQNGRTHTQQLDVSAQDVQAESRARHCDARHECRVDDMRKNYESTQCWQQWCYRSLYTQDTQGRRQNHIQTRAENTNDDSS